MPKIGASRADPNDWLPQLTSHPQNRIQRALSGPAPLAQARFGPPWRARPHPRSRAVAEANLPTECFGAQAASRFPCTDEDGEWPQGPRAAPRQGPQAPVSLDLGRPMPDPVQRLKRRVDFLRVARGRKWVSPGVIVQARSSPGDKNKPLPSLRVGFTVTKKVGGATVRNRARRRLRAAADQVLPVHGSPGHDIVLIGRRATLDRPFKALVDDLETALRRLDVWREENAGAE